jgi:hypothetical protein
MLKLSEFLGSAITSSLQLNFESEKGWSKGQFRWRFLLLSLLMFVFRRFNATFVWLTYFALA